MVSRSSVETVNNSDLARSFPPVFESDAQVLILGSMPGRASLQACQYYAYPYNAFWPIIEHLFGVCDPLNYTERIRLITRQRIALWDVLKICVRNGSLDSSIKSSSMVANDFSAFYEAAPDIHTVFFNGATAEREYAKRVLPTLPRKYALLAKYRLPSTSPAMAGMKKEQKIAQWQRITQILNTTA